jgi:transposase-like protein
MKVLRSMSTQVNVRRPGRPRSIPANMIPEVISLYRGGLGYRAIARELTKGGVSVDWSTVRRVIKSNQSGQG